MDTEKLYAARLRACTVRPYLATALWALEVVPSRSVATMAVDRYWRCYVSPAFVDMVSLDDLAGVWVHEVSHLLRDHHGRAQRLVRDRGLDRSVDRFRINLAADCEINDDIFDEQLPQPAGALTPAALKLVPGQLLEEYVTHISPGPLTDPYAWHDCGSGADGLARSWDLGADGADGLSEAECEALRFHVARGLVGAPGSAPAGWRRWAGWVVHPPQAWRELLGAALRSVVTGHGIGDDYTYARPSRRSASLPTVVLPSLRRQLPRVSIVVDTSGSVSDDELGSALLEVTAILKALGGRRDLITVLSCDAATHTVSSLCQAEGVSLIGGGGTDMRTGVAAALERRPRPDVIVILTDGQTPWPQTRPACRVIIGLFPRPTQWRESSEYEPSRPPDWAHVVTIG